MTKQKLTELCKCGSGRRYKDCHYVKQNRTALSGWRDVPLSVRNALLIRGAEDIFGFRKGRTWDDFQQNIADEEIREFFKLHGSMWGPETNWSGIMPQAGDGKLRGLYLGDIRPELMLRNVIRFSLYNDQLLIVDPFPNSRILRPNYNPIDNPGQYKSEMIKLIYVLFQLAPWIDAGVVRLIPDPGDIDLKLKHATLAAAKARMKDVVPDNRDLDDARAVGKAELRRFLFSLPDDVLVRQVEIANKAQFSDAEKKAFLEYAKQELSEDPLAWRPPGGTRSGEGQLKAFRGGTNLETALLICEQTGAFPYTNIRTVWGELIKSRDELSETARVWAPLARAFQELEFKFLDGVDVKFASNIREDGRLEGFRSFLRTVGKQASEVGSLTSLELFVRDAKDALVGEHQKARAEWAKIQDSFSLWVGGGIGSALISGQMFPDVAALSAATVSTMVQLYRRHLKRKHFRQTNPMSVFIDLSEKEPPGTVIF